jgi:hypothetical protein
MESIYLETTVISYLVARPSRDLVLAAHQSVTRDWWENERVKYRCIVSDEVVREARRGESEMARRRIELISGLEIVSTTADMRMVSEALMATGAMPRAMVSDALHLAIAMLSDAQFLLTWNCRHLANAAILRRLEREARRIRADLAYSLHPA